MLRAIPVAPNVLIPAGAMRVRSVRASGPGGQNVNKVATKVEVRVDVAAIQGLDERSRTRLTQLAARRLDAAGRLVVTSQRTRDQSRNLDDALAKVRSLIEAALEPPRPRVPTKVPARSKQSRLREKQRRSRTKSERKLQSDR